MHPWRTVSRWPECQSRPSACSRGTESAAEMGTGARVGGAEKSPGCLWRTECREMGPWQPPLGDLGEPAYLPSHAWGSRSSNSQQHRREGGGGTCALGWSCKPLRAHPGLCSTPQTPFLGMKPCWLVLPGVGDLFPVIRGRHVLPSRRRGSCTEQAPAGGSL